ncbi:MAG TPA: uracil-DNA glycosylase [Dissulfurispiraceae bacterium]|nr:uracil-DNA glycosylase [Dissulfurispiraceae bacterium]
MSLFNTLWGFLEEGLFSVPSSTLLFNQYRNNIPGIDLPRGSEIRKENLSKYLRSFTRRPSVLVVGEAAGPWGCRFSGIPFTSERQLTEGSLPFRGEQSSTHEPPYTETSGTIVWKSLLSRYPDFFLWNAVPLHPHKKGEPLTIRKPSRAELLAFSEILSRIVTTLVPKRVIAVGRTAEQALLLLGKTPVYVRHPSQAGATEFREGIVRALS